MSLIYDGNKIIPSPLVSLSKEYHKTGDGTKLGSLYSITLTGTLLPFKGSPDSTFTLDSPSDAFWQLGGYPPDQTPSVNNDDFANLQRKQEALRWLFSRDGMNLEWQATGGQEVVKCNPRILSINIPEGQWADKCGYIIEMETDKILIARGSEDSEDNFDYDLIQDGSEQWDFSETEGKVGTVLEVSHMVTAKSVQGYELDGQSLGDSWDQARLWCESKVDGSISSGIMNVVVSATNWIGGSYSKTTGIGQSDGTYSISEKWSLGENNTFIEKSFSMTRPDRQGDIEVTYQGVIYGLSDGEKTGGPNAIAQAKLMMPTNAQAKADTEAALAGSNFLGSNVLPDTPKQKNITINNKDGTISFSFQWSTDEDDDFFIENEASLAFSVGDGLYVMTYTTTIEGKGDTVSDRLSNAELGLPANDLAAHTSASILLSSQIDDLPGGTIISTDPISKSTAINEKRGIIGSTWSWNTVLENNVDIQVENIFPRYITAQIPIPGRKDGPVIQRMNTKTARQISVTYGSRGTSTKPDADTIAAVMDAAGGIPHFVGDALFDPESYILENDRETWNDTTKQYNRARTHTVTED